MAGDSWELREKGTVKTRIMRVDSEGKRIEDDQLVVEEPLEIAARNKTGLLSLGAAFRTPGEDEALAIGMLYTEGLLRGMDQVVSVTRKKEDDATVPVSRIVVEVTDEVDTAAESRSRAFPISAACGACGKSVLEALRIQRTDAFHDNEGLRWNEGIVRGLPAQLQERQSHFRRTGGLHAAARFGDKGLALDVAEDVGRHNAMDKLAGRWLRAGNGPSWTEQAIVFSGRVGFDLMQKVLAVGCPVVASVGAPSSFAVELATLFNVTLIGFLRDSRFNVYSGLHRIEFSE